MREQARTGRFTGRAGAAAAALAAIGAVVFALFAVVAPTAHAATLLSDNFEDGNLDGWTRSGGSWSVLTRWHAGRPAEQPEQRRQGVGRAVELDRLRGADPGKGVAGHHDEFLLLRRAP